MVRVLARVVVDFEGGGLERGGDLGSCCSALEVRGGGRFGGEGKGGITLSRMASSMGVEDMVEMSLARRNGLRRSIPAQKASNSSVG